MMEWFWRLAETRKSLTLYLSIIYIMRLFDRLKPLHLTELPFTPSNQVD